MDLFGDFWYVWVLPFVGGIIWYLITKAAVKAPGSMLQAKFANLTKDTNGVIAGKTYQQIVAACGAPSSVSPAGNGGKLCQWIATSYHIALLFDANDVCTGITHEVKV